MPRSGIKILSETAGTGSEIKESDKVLVCYDVALNRGEIIANDQETILSIGDREVVAGFRYGLEGMRIGGTRKFKASPHLCYRENELEKIPKNAVLVFTIKSLQLVH